MSVKQNYEVSEFLLSDVLWQKTVCSFREAFGEFVYLFSYFKLTCFHQGYFLFAVSVFAIWRLMETLLVTPESLLIVTMLTCRAYSQPASASYVCVCVCNPTWTHTHRFTEKQKPAALLKSETCTARDPDTFPKQNWVGRRMAWTISGWREMTWYTAPIHRSRRFTWIQQRTGRCWSPGELNDCTLNKQLKF